MVPPCGHMPIVLYNICASRVYFHLLIVTLILW
uniref:Uncharacterized protein n=1 Tax=Anguilla anguilla TaxID=7936 RepID=A0A0E9R7M3_ANGAN